MESFEKMKLKGKLDVKFLVDKFQNNMMSKF